MILLPSAFLPNNMALLPCFLARLTSFPSTVARMSLFLETVTFAVARRLSQLIVYSPAGREVPRKTVSGSVACRLCVRSFQAQRLRPKPPKPLTSGCCRACGVSFAKAGALAVKTRPIAKTDTPR